METLVATRSLEVSMVSEDEGVTHGIHANTASSKPYSDCWLQLQELWGTKAEQAMCVLRNGITYEYDHYRSLGKRPIPN